MPSGTVADSGAAALGANALRNRRAKPLGVSGADKALFTSDAAQMDDMMPEMLSESMGPYKSYGAGNPKRRGFNFAMKKGGRVKKGFAKKKKQANKMRKK